jgi:hypothetical protein
MADTWRTRGAIVHEGEHRPYGRRTVQIELTTEQQQQLQGKLLGTDSGKPVHEELLDCWLEEIQP